MTDREAIEAFVSHKKLALVGLSRSGRKFSNNIYRDLTGKGYRIYPINPSGTEGGAGVQLYRNFRELPEPVAAALFMTPRSQTLKAVQGAVEEGVSMVWIQQGADSQEVVNWCREKKVPFVSGHCILMFAEPVALFHRVHRGLLRLVGKLPA
jgi:uncharacterized protein